MLINGYFVLLFDLAPGRGASEGHTFHLESGNIRVESKFNKTLPEAITCLLYQELDNSILINLALNVTIDFYKLIDTAQILWTLLNVNSFLDVFSMTIPTQIEVHTG